ncbi:MAG TPA: RHS repeat-associated core domain-containing protein, partial [Flavipsychrobacter sp.]|nr:RHS repeat-associated core domain-containing protein [Flavipsychrobacter sp.]
SYSPGDLLVTETKDEQGVTYYLYTDKRGQKLAKAVNMGGEQYSFTYNVYDAFGYLRAVIQPEGVKELNNTVGTSYTLSGTFIDKWCFTYDYDEWGRIIEKKLPGVQPVYNVYNSKDQLVLVQDGELRKKGQWVFTKYDALSRMVLTGSYTTSLTASRSNMQDSVNAVASTFESRTAANYSTQQGYTLNQSFPKLVNAAQFELFTVSYYDDYDYDSNNLTTDTWFTALGRGTEPEPCYRTQGAYTGSKQKVLGSNPAKYLTTSSFYDKDGRVIQAASGNILGRMDIVTSRFDFTGSALETVTYHGGSSDIYVVQQFNYDHARRLLSVTHQVERDEVKQPMVVLMNKGYNELGQTTKKQLHSTDQLNYLQKIDYTYNIRGWLTAINDASLTEATDLFGEEIKYNKGQATPFSPVKYYNGNISEVWYNDRYSNKPGYYAFFYDPMGRLLNARYASKAAVWKEVDGNNETIAYDLNGNITSLNRYQWPTAATARESIDALSYTYTGNLLKKVEDNAGAAAAGGFVNGSVDTGEYIYDDNGNMTVDKNKGITAIKYNFLNLPEEVTIAGKGKITYAYTALGVRVSKQVAPLAGATVTTQYVNGFEYVNGTLQSLATSEGRVVFTTMGCNYEYSLKDHLGNTRICFDRNPSTGSARIIQKTDYYPFGMTMQGNYVSGAQNKYQYNGKEIQDELSLQWYDYGARMYDPQIGRWSTSDPLGHTMTAWSNYNYSFCNPVRFIDPDGRSPMADYYDNNGKRIGTDGINDGKIYIVYGHDEDVVKDNEKHHQTTQVSALQDPILLPTWTVRQGMAEMVRRSNSRNDRLDNEFKGNDNQGGFHEEGGVFTEDRIIHAKPGLKTNPEIADATVNPFIPADGSDIQSFGKGLGTVHVHSKGKVPIIGSSNEWTFINAPTPKSASGNGDYMAFGTAKSLGYLQQTGSYGI